MKKRALICGGVIVAVVGVLVLRLRSGPPVPVIWQCYIPSGVSNRVIPASTNDTAYVLAGGQFIAVDRNGKKLWTFPSGVEMHFPAVVGNDGTIYSRGSWSTNSAVFAFRPDGSLKWKYVVNGIVGTDFDLAIDGDGAVLFGTEDRYIIALSPDGTEKWRLPTVANVSAPITTGSGLMFFSGIPNSPGSQTVFCVNSNKEIRYTSPCGGWYPSELSVDWDETVYFPGRAPNTMRALNPNGSVKWTYMTSTEMALSAPTIARDGSLYFRVGGSGIKGCPLCALSRDGKKKWELPLGDQVCFTPPVVASDGTLFVVDGDPKLTAVNPDGTIRWVFNPPRKWAFRLPLRIRIKIPRNWNDLKDLWKIFFPDPQHSFPASPALTSRGILYVGFGTPYDTLYALNVGVGPDTNSPWPMEMANAQRTRLLAPRPPPSGPAGK